MSSTAERKTNYAYIEILRVISAMAVIVVHVSGANWYRIPIGSADWTVQAFFNLAGRYSVCVFCMISGALFLRPGKERSLREILSRYGKRMLICLLVWDLIYAAIYTAMDQGDAVDFFQRLFRLPDHLWYLLMLMGMYLALAVLYAITKNRAATRYLIWLLILFGVLDNLTVVNGFFGGMAGENLGYSLGRYFLRNLATLKSAFLPGYLAFFLLGHYIHEYGLGAWHRRIVASAVPALLLSALLTVWLSQLTGDYIYSFMLETNPLVVLASAGIFAFFRGEGEAPRERDTQSLPAKTMAWLGSNTFGIYLIHFAVRDLLANCLNFSVASYPAIFSVPLNSLLIFAVSLALTVLVKMIPGLGLVDTNPCRFSRADLG